MTWTSKVRDASRRLLSSLEPDPFRCYTDQEWLDAVNAERVKGVQPRVTHELFEIIMDRLEKEWFDLVSWTLFQQGSCLTRCLV
jgi:hypothetical protein